MSRVELDMHYNPSYRGNILRYDFWHDLGRGTVPCGQAGIRLDDAICGVLVYGNGTQEDPGFIDARRQNFGLRSEVSINERPGFRPIPLAKIGLYPEDACAARPPAE